MYVVLKAALVYGFFLSFCLATTHTYPASSQSFAAATGHVMPKFPWRTSKVFGQFRRKGFYSDWWERLQHNGEAVYAPQYHIVGIRGSCGARVDAIQLIYRKGKEEDYRGKLCGNTGGRMNPPIYSPGSWDYHAVNITIGEYISKVEISVCNHKNSDRICYLNFHSNFGKSIMECGTRPRLPLLPEVVDSDIYPNKRGRLYSAQGHTGDEVDMMQLIWVPV